MHYSRTAAVLLAAAALPLTITAAGTCNSSNAQPYTASQTAVDAAFVTCSTSCGTRASCLLRCLDTACTSHCGSSSSSCHSSCLADPCSAFYGSGSDTPNPTALQACYKARDNATPTSNLRLRNLQQKRATTLTCTSSETCYTETNGNLFCLNTNTGEYHDTEGGKGNVNTGAYTSGSDVVPEATTTSANTATETDSSSSSSASITSAATTTTGSASAAAATTPAASGNAAGEQVQANAAAFGILGLALGFLVV